jgi:very-short-patch-repair endonuclease
VLFARQLRKNLTKAESILKARLRGKQTGYKFRFQSPVRGYIADFLVAKGKFIVEVDGSYHNSIDQQEYDRRRTEHLENTGYKILRITNDEVFSNIDLVVERIIDWIKQ